MARIEQKVVFKAQLFVPFSEEKRNFKLINEACLSGIYFTKSELPTLKDNSFYFPSKLEWTAIPNQNVNWMNFEHFINEVKLYLTAEKSPMFWSKDRKGTISKCFAVWW